MEKQEFLKLCHDCGYCKKEIAEEYVKTHEQLSEEDFVNVYRTAHGEKIGKPNGHNIKNGRTTKSYDSQLSDRRMLYRKWRWEEKNEYEK